MSFTELWTLLDTELNKPPNTTFEMYKLLNLLKILGSTDGLSEYMQHKGERRSRVVKRYLHLYNEKYGNSTETTLSHDKPVGSAQPGLD